MEKIIKFFKLAANGIKDIEFLKYLFPLLAVVGSIVFLYFGCKGVVLKSTINLFKISGFTYRESNIGKITGMWALVFGVFYIALGLFLLFFLGGISYYMWFKG